MAVLASSSPRVVATPTELIEAIRSQVTGVASHYASTVDKDGRFPVETLDALRGIKALSAPVPRELGGFGYGLRELSGVCSTLAGACGSSAMVLAMHYIQVACLVRHGSSSPHLRQYLQDLVENQYLIGSMTSEVGTQGDTRSSVCAVERNGGRFTLNKEATTASYCAHADAILVTSRRSADAAASDQVLVLVRKTDCTLKQTTSWDTMGMRGTCSPGFSLQSTGPEQHIVPGAFADSSAQTMVPYSHILWASLWWGIAADAVAKAGQFIRGEARKNPGTLPPGAVRLAEVSAQLQAMRSQWQMLAQEFDDLTRSPHGEQELTSLGWALKMNNLKVNASETAPQVVHKALQIIGVLGFKNDSKFSVARNYRDVLSASLMISNDRIIGKSASMLLVFKDE
jgi:acyl-CoA dehydrogenase